MALYASYLPESVYAEKKNEDPSTCCNYQKCHLFYSNHVIVLAEIEEAVRKMADGQDPISIYEARVQVVQSELVKKVGELGKLEHTLQTEYVPKVSKDAVDESLMEAKVDYRFL